MLDAETDAQLEQLLHFVCSYDRAGRTPRQFWEEFDLKATELAQRAWADDAAPDLLEGYTAVLACADDAGFVVPESYLDAPLQS